MLRENYHAQKKRDAVYDFIPLTMAPIMAPMTTTAIMLTTTQIITPMIV
jgi:hypothetical protein